MTEHNEPPVQPPTREQIAELVWVRHNPGTHLGTWGDMPRRWQGKYLDTADAVLALFQQPTEAMSAVEHDEECLLGEWNEAAGVTCVCTCGASAEPVSIADMAPGTTFRAQAYAQAYQMWRVVNATTVEHQSGFHHHVSVIDPSTIRDVTPPPATPKEPDRG